MVDGFRKYTQKIMSLSTFHAILVFKNNVTLHCPLEHPQESIQIYWIVRIENDDKLQINILVVGHHRDKKNILAQVH